MRFELLPYTTCSFCQDLAGERECAFIAENEHAVAQVDERQYERGAMLVIPRSHRESVLDIESIEIQSIYSLVRDIARAATAAFGAMGMNVFQNNGSKAGQHEPHFHVHVIPRYPTSDMSQRFNEGVFPQTPIDELERLAERMRTALSADN